MKMLDILRVIALVGYGISFPCLCVFMVVHKDEIFGLVVGSVGYTALVIASVAMLVRSLIVWARNRKNK